MNKVFLILLAAILFCRAARAEDEIELRSGTRIRGKILERTEQTIRIEVTVENRALIRSYPMNRVRSVTQNGQRQAAGSPSAAPPAPSTAAPSGVSNAASELIQRTPAEIDSLLEQTGRTPPDWFDSTPLEYPETLNLAWPEPTPVVWNYTRNIDHFLYDIIDANPNRHRSGIRFMHHVLIANQNNPNTRLRAMNELGRMYFEFFRDYARAAFWWRQAGVEANPKFTGTPSPARLAECYWRLGNRAMATTLLERLPLTLAVIKTWGVMRETEKALQLCDRAIQQGFPPSQTYLLAGDACRTVKDFNRAAEFYQKVLKIPAEGNSIERIKRDQEQARDTLETIRLFDRLDLNRIPDGAFAGKSLGYAGSVEVEATVKAGRIDAIKVLNNPDRQYFRAVEDTIRRILTRQTVQGVDAVSGATFTSEAVIRASAKALAEGMRTNSVSK